MVHLLHYGPPKKSPFTKTKTVEKSSSNDSSSDTEAAGDKTQYLVPTSAYMRADTKAATGPVISPPSKYSTICRFFLQDKCTKGKDCPFSHKRPICKQYLKNCCKYGDKCLKVHPEKKEPEV